jgi:serine/threonine protein kinase
MESTLATTFLQRLQASRLLPAEQVAQARATAGDEEPNLSRYLVQRGLLTPFQARQLRLGSASFIVDKYVVVDFLGRGAHSIVYKARNTLLPNRYVALKTIDMRDLHRGEEALARFRREVEAMASLDHPSVVRAYDVIERRSQVYLVLEYVDGCDLGKLVTQRGRLPVIEAVGYAVQAAQGLAYAHRRGLVHRDIKPANLLLPKEGPVKIADLGLARFLTAGPKAENPDRGLCLGTPEFMAPEQAENAAEVDARADLYSLGATLYHLLTAELPVKGGTYFNRIKHLLTNPARPLAEARPDVSPGLAAVVDRLRARIPADRPASAEEAIALLEPFAHIHGADDPKRWDANRKAALVLEVLQGRASASEACTRHGLAVEEFERWRQRFLDGATQALDPSAAPVEDVRELYAKIGAQAMEIETLKSRWASGMGSV